jgi:hypothetical protein
VRDTRYQWAYIFGAVCPGRGVGAALVLPRANTRAMNLHLAEIAANVSHGAHALVILDGAGWHRGNDLVVPPNITLLTLPPYAPELTAPRTSGSTCARTSSPSASTPTTTPSWTPAARHGTTSSPTQPASPPSQREHGLTCYELWRLV